MGEVAETAYVAPTARVYDSAQVLGSAAVGGSARVYDSAVVGGSARVYGRAQVGGEGNISAQHHVAWVDRVGSGCPMTLHRIRRNGGFGWRINAGCCHFEADTIDAVCAAVRANVAAGPDEWAHEDEATRARWAAQVDAALTFLASMCHDDEEAPRG